MKIVEQSPDRLVFHSSPWGLRGMGVVFAAASAGLFTVVLRDRAHGTGIWVAYVVCGIFGIAGLAMLLTATDRRIIFERLTSSAQVIRVGGILPSQMTNVSFSEIRDIALESSVMTSGNGARTINYRIVFVLKDGSRVPWTTVLTGDVGSQSACVAAARSFGGWDTAAAKSGAALNEVARPTPAPGTAAILGSAAPPAAGVRTTVRNNATQNVGCVIAFLAVFTVVGTGLMGLQVERYLTYRPAPARVIGGTVEEVRGSKGGSTYRPVITYTYAVDGREYTSSNVSIIKVSRGWKWANGVVTRYRPGTETTAWYDPQDPSKSYLLHEISTMPLVFVIVPLVFGVLVVVSSRWNSRQVAIASVSQVPVLPLASSAPKRAA